MKQNSELPTGDESKISKPEFKAIRESILAICAQKRLLNALSVYELPLKEEHRQETYIILAELHNSRKIDLIEVVIFHDSNSLLRFSTPHSRRYYLDHGNYSKLGSERWG